jgi:dipeptidase
LAARPIGGVVWLGYDNPATTPHTPFYIGISQMPASYMVDGRWEFSRDCAWWAFRTVSKLALFRWQEMTQDIEKVWRGIEEKAFADQAKFEEEALALYKKDPKKAREMLTRYSHACWPTAPWPPTGSSPTSSCTATPAAFS